MQNKFIQKQNKEIKVTFKRLFLCSLLLLVSDKIDLTNMLSVLLDKIVTETFCGNCFIDQINLLVESLQI
jgi:hypothetical protein